MAVPPMHWTVLNIWCIVPGTRCYPENQSSCKGKIPLNRIMGRYSCEAFRPKTVFIDEVGLCVTAGVLSTDDVRKLYL